MKKTLFATYAISAYAVFFATFLYMIGFVGDFLVPKTINSGTGEPWPTALLINLGLIALFGVQHTVMARPGFKRVWTKIVPKPIERATYVLLSAVILIATFAYWQPISATVWSIETPMLASAATALFFAGWGLVLLSTFLIDHFDLFGLRQVYEYALDRIRGDDAFQVRFLYRIVRHPLMVGWFVTFWATPVMTVGHFVFAAGMSVYILIALVYEERDLVEAFGDKYRDYQRQVPKLIPFVKPRTKAAPGRAVPSAAAE